MARQALPVTESTRGNSGESHDAALSRGQREALRMLRLARATDPSTDDGTLAVCATFYDHEVNVAYVNHRTADRLAQRGLVEYGRFDPDGTELRLTEAGLG